jgi:cellulose synthase/poly-beta-1,6-N-acetylglucosamine synthase-like glycosyltransferase
VISPWSASGGYLSGLFAAFHLGLGRWFVKGLEALRPCPPLEDSALPGATVLVAARNEAEHAPELAACLLALDYPADRLSLIVVDDRSEDGTGEILRREGRGRIEVIRVESCPPRVAPKKNALLRGLASSRSEIVAVVDADNRPEPGWLRAHASRLTGNVGVSAGLVYHGRDPSVPEGLHGIWAAEIFALGALSAGAVGRGFPLSANGGNLAYRRRAFDQAGAYARNIGVVSGDDDFLVQAVAARTPWRVDFAIEPQTQVPTQGPRSWEQAWEQRKRWASKCVRYERPQVVLLSAVFASYAWALALLLCGLFHPLAFLWLGLVWGAMWLHGWMVYAKGLEVFGPKVRKAWFPLTMAMQIPMAVAASLLGTFGRFRWKDGAVRKGMAEAP